MPDRLTYLSLEVAGDVPGGFIGVTDPIYQTDATNMEVVFCIDYPKSSSSRPDHL